MESVFQRDFSQVRIHTDSNAVRLSQHFNAQAFTIGNHIAFASGQYRPGAVIGDALLAHELAHVSQQSQAGASAVAMQAGGAEYDSLERDADVSAAHAVVSLWGQAKAKASGLAQHVAPRLKSGLRMSMFGLFGAAAGCKGCQEQEEATKLSCAEICEWASPSPGFNKGFGSVICYYGKKCPCIFYNPDPNPDLDIPVNVKLGECPKLDNIVMIHEQRHADEGECDSSKIHLMGTTDPAYAIKVECQHRTETVKLLDDAIKSLDDADPCKAKMTIVRNRREEWGKKYCGG
jgi:uncharacterized protein DUF4157